MAKPKLSLEERIRILEIKDAACMAMHRYWRCLDYKKFDELPDVFTEDAYGDWGMETWRKTGRKQICEWLQANESQEGLRLCHFGHNPEIAVVSDTEARGVFLLEDWVTIHGMTIMRGFGQYNMVFVEGEDGVWRIKNLHLVHAYRESIQRFLEGKMITTTPELSK